MHVCAWCQRLIQAGPTGFRGQIVDNYGICRGCLKRCLDKLAMVLPTLPQPPYADAESDVSPPR